jgi:uncharacterized protein (TIGR02271 family)
MLSSDGGASGPLAAYLDPNSLQTSSSSAGIQRALVEMGLSESEARNYLSGVRSGYTLETAIVDDARADEALAIMKAHAPSRARPSRKNANANANASGSLEGTSNRTETVVPVVAERLDVGKREVAAGGIRVTETVKTVPVEQDVTLRQETVDVERRPADRPVSAGDDVFGGRTIEVTATTEEPVVEKTPRVVEEVVITKGASTRTETIRDTVRKTDIDVEDLSSSFAKHFERQYGGEGRRFDDYAPAYEYGRQLSGSEWSSVEPDARARWEAGRPGTWDRFKAAIRHAWENAKH